MTYYITHLVMECKLMQQRSKIYGIQLTTSTWTVLRIHYIKLNSASVGVVGNLARFQTVWLTGVKQSNWDKQIFEQQMLNIHHIQQMPLCFALQPNFAKTHCTYLYTSPCSKHPFTGKIRLNISVGNKSTSYRKLEMVLWLQLKLIEAKPKFAETTIAWCNSVRLISLNRMLQGDPHHHQYLLMFFLALHIPSLPNGTPFCILSYTLQLLTSYTRKLVTPEPAPDSIQCQGKLSVFSYIYSKTKHPPYWEKKIQGEYQYKPISFPSFFRYEFIAKWEKSIWELFYNRCLGFWVLKLEAGKLERLSSPSARTPLSAEELFRPTRFWFHGW